MQERKPPAEFKTALISTLEQDAYRPAPDIKELERDKLQVLLKRVYSSSASYTFPNGTYNKQLELIVKEFSKLAKTQNLLDEKEIAILNSFPTYALEMLASCYQSQTKHFPKGVKESLEVIVYQLNQTSIPSDRKKVVLSKLMEEIIVCNTGIYEHLDEAAQELSSLVSMPQWQAELRTDIVKALAATHAKAKAVDSSSHTHVGIVYLQEAKKAGLEPQGDLTKIIETFEKNAKVTPQDKKRMVEDFHVHYNLRASIEHFSDKFAAEVGVDWQNYDETVVKIKKTTASLALKKFPINFLEDKIEDDKSYVRFSPELFKRIFLQYCYRNEFLVKKECWEEEKVFKNYKLIHARTFPLLDLAWVEDPADEGSICDFSNLSVEEQYAYFEFSFVFYGVPDRFNLLDTAVFPETVFNTLEKILPLIQKLEEENSLIYALILFKKFFQSQSALFIEVIVSLRPKTVERVFYMMEMDYSLVQVKDPLGQSFIQLGEMAAKLDEKQFPNKTSFCSWLTKKITDAEDQRKIFLKSIGEEKESVIIYSHLLKKERSIASTDQYIYRAFLRHYFRQHYNKLNNSVEIDFANEFQQAHCFSISKLDDNQRDLFARTKDGILLEDVEYDSLKLFDLTGNLLCDWALKCHSQAALNKFSEVEFKKFESEPASFPVILLKHNKIDDFYELLKKETLSLKTKEMILIVACFTGIYDLIQQHFGPKLKINCSVFQGSLNYLAISEGRLDIVQLLMILGPATSSHKLLIHAVQMDSLDMLSFVIINGGNLNERFQRWSGRTPLFLAIEKNNYFAVKMLLDHDAKVNVTDDLGATPLHYAAQRGFLKIIQLLLDSGANPVALCEGVMPCEGHESPVVKLPLLLAAVKQWEREERCRDSKFYPLNVETVLDEKAEFFKIVLENSPENFAQVLLSLDSDSARRLLFAMDIGYILVTPCHPLHNQFLKLPKLVGQKNIHLSDMIVNTIYYYSMQFDRVVKFQKTLSVAEQKEPQILFSTWLSYARHAADDTQLLFQSLLRHFYRNFYYEVVISDDIDFKSLFGNIDFGKHNELFFLRKAAMDGDMKAIDANTIYTSSLNLIGVCIFAQEANQQPLLDKIFAFVKTFYQDGDTLDHTDRRYNRTLFEWALDCNQPNVYKTLLLAKGKSLELTPDPRWLEWALLAATACANFKMIKKLYSLGVNPQSKHVRNAFDYTVSFGQLEIMQFFINNGADVNFIGKSALPCVLSAILNRAKHVIPPLLDAGADASAAAEDGNTALHELVKENDTLTLSLLLSAGANPCALFKGKKPADLTQDVGMVALLLTAELDLLRKTVLAEKPAPISFMSRFFKSYSQAEKLAAIDTLQNYILTSGQILPIKQFPVLKTPPFLEFYERFLKYQKLKHKREDMSLTS